MASNLLEKVLRIAKDHDISCAPNASKMSLVYNGQPIFKGSLDECYVYLQGWRDGWAAYLADRDPPRDRD